MRQSDYNSSNPGPRPRRVLPRIGITMGDPAGIGPEVVLKAVAEDEVKKVVTAETINQFEAETKFI